MLKKIFVWVVNIFGVFLILNTLSLANLPLTSQAQIVAPPQTTAERCAAYKDQFKIGTSTNATNISNDVPVFCSATQAITTVINYGLAISGSVTILFLMVGGFWYLTSAGSEEQAEKGKKTIINSVIGLVVIILSYTIVRIIAGTLSLGK